MKFLVDGKLHEKLRENGWDSQFYDISSISYVEDKEFEDAFSTINNSTLGFRYADEYYEFNLLVE